MKFSTVFAGAFALSLGSAHAACVAPQGVYVGSGGGAIYSGAYYTVGSMQFSVNIPASGKWVFNGWIKQQNLGTRSVKFNAPAISNASASKNKFDAVTCRGVVTTDPDPTTKIPYVFSYVVSDDGKQISVINFDGNVDVVADFVIILNKV